jgi:PBSX family phage terminase large subunit
LNPDKFKPGRIFEEMCEIYEDNYSPENEKVLTICNEGGSRAQKTWDVFHLMYIFCNHNKDKNNDIYCLRDTLTNCRDYTFKDFKDCMNVIEVNLEYRSEGQKPYTNIFGNNLFFRGLDDESNMEGFPSDIIFVNETLEVAKKERLAGIIMRCRKLVIFDWNPKFTTHWAFDLEGRPNVFFTHSTYKDNPHLQKSIIGEIESYCPWHFDDFHLDEDDRRPHPENIKNGTADKYRWKVYGEGIRAAPEGLIFQYVKYIDEWPADVAYINSIDFGFVIDPLAMGRVGETRTDIYAELLCYEPIERPEDIDSYADKIGMNKRLPTIADSSDKYTGENKGTVEMVKGLRLLGWSINKIHKTKSVMYWLLDMKGKTINIIINHLVHHARKEQENYKMKVINGIAINQPEDKFNHFWDMVRYGHMALNQPKGIRSKQR